MSDNFRKDFSTRAQEKITPDSSKSGFDKAKEGVTNTADRTAAEVQSDSSKSNTQEAFDKSRREKDHSKAQGESTMDKIKDKVGLGHKD